MLQPLANAQTMSAFKKLGFLSIYLMILLSNGVFILTHGQFTWTGVLFAYGVVPLVDALMGKDKNNAAKEDFERLMNDRFFDSVVYSLVYVHLIQLGLAVFAILTYEMTLFQWIGYVLSLGIFAGTMINVAHELGHRSSKTAQFHAKLTLMTVCYMHFFIEHNRGHHVWVATPHDPATARKGQSLYAFWWQSVTGSFRSALAIERRLLEKANVSFWSIRNNMIWAVLLPLLFCGLLTALGSWKAGRLAWEVIPFFFGQSLVAILLLESVNYIEHYGIVRREIAPGKRWGYWTWIVALTWGVFELLQLRQDRDPEFVDENSLVTLVLTGIIIGFGYIADAFRVRREQLVLQQQKTEAELTALKSQINPHFLFNTLNTIYNEAAGAQNDTVADLVQQLASIMRFTLQESAKPFISVESELAFLDKYLTLQRARLPQRDSIRVDIHMDYDGQPARIAPLLLIPFVENAFQYGISFENPCFVKINLVIENQTLTLQLQNSTFPKATHRKGHGMGIHNVRQRLKLIYPHQYTLEIKDEEAVFEIQMSIKL